MGRRISDAEQVRFQLESFEFTQFSVNDVMKLADRWQRNSDLQAVLSYWNYAVQC